MFAYRLFRSGLLGSLLILGATLLPAAGQTGAGEAGFGPVVRAYLGYLKNEQEVVDDRASRHEVSVSYYRRNSNRIRALRQMALQIARESQNDYLPELEAVAGDEFGLLFERPPRFQSLKIGEVVQTNFRYLGAAHSGETFYVFARLDPYEQSELIQKVSNSAVSATGSPVSGPVSATKVSTRARRVVPR
jgi:hypothetical protein